MVGKEVSVSERASRPSFERASRLSSKRALGLSSE